MSLNKINFVEFWEPKKATRSGSKSDYELSALIGLPGKTRKQSNYTLAIERFLKKNNINWSYLRIGQIGKKLVISEGNESNGYKIHDNLRISNKDLLNNIFLFYDEKVPFREDEKKLIHFSATFNDDLQLFILNRVQ
jgi:hypothetical protein